MAQLPQYANNANATNTGRTTDYLAFARIGQLNNLLGEVNAQDLRIGATEAGTVTGATGLTALAGGAQAGTALAVAFNDFTVVATTGDSAQLPAAALGKTVIVRNSAAIAMVVFGQTGDSINGGTVNTGVTVGPGQEVIFEATGTTTWITAQGVTGAVTQGSSITTGVTLNARKGIITTFTPSTAGLAATTFTVTNNKATAAAHIEAYVTDYGGTVITNGMPYVFVKNKTASGFDVVIYNAHATNALATSLKIGFEIKA